MSFFVTSNGLGTGGDLRNGQADGLAGGRPLLQDARDGGEPGARREELEGVPEHGGGERAATASVWARGAMRRA